MTSRHILPSGARSPIGGAWRRISSPKAVIYLRARLGTAEGRLELIEIQLRLTGERYIFRFTDQGDGRTYADRPQGWSAEDEQRAIQDLSRALQRRNETT